MSRRRYYRISTQTFTLILVITMIFIAGILTGCANKSMGIYPAEGPVTIKGLPPIFSAGVWICGCYNSDSRVAGLTMSITPQGNVSIRIDGIKPQFWIEENTIVLEKPLDGIKIVEIKVGELGSIVAIGQGEQVENGTLGQFVKSLNGKSCP